MRVWIMQKKTLAEFPKNNDSNFKLVSNLNTIISDDEGHTNFKNLKKDINNSTFIVNCNKYGIKPATEDENICYSMSIKVEDLFNIENITCQLANVGCSMKDDLYLYNDLYVLVSLGNCNESGSIKIFDKLGKLVFEENIISSYIDNKNVTHTYKYKIFNNELHYLKNENNQILYYVMNLNDFSKKNIEKIDGQNY